MDAIPSRDCVGCSVPSVGNLVRGRKVGTPVGDAYGIGVRDDEVGDIAADPGRGYLEGAGDGRPCQRDGEHAGGDEGEYGFHVVDI